MAALQGRGATRKQARSIGVDAGGGGGGGDSALLGSEGIRKEKRACSSVPLPAMARVSASCATPKNAAASLVDVTVEDADALDCGVCFLPLRAPIFQCDVGHMVCSPCHDRLKSRGKCHMCGVATGSYRRCYGMERLVESISVPCPNAAHGCSTKLLYHDRDNHGSACLHAPCHCPGEACGFVGSTAALLDHFSGTHGWPCKTARLGVSSFSASLRDGFNFVVSSDADKHGRKYLFLLDVVRHSFYSAVSVVCIRPHAAATDEVRFVLSYPARSNGNRLVKHEQRAVYLEVPCSDLSGGLPDRNGSYQFIVPEHDGGDDEHDMTKVMVDIITDLA